MAQSLQRRIHALVRQVLSSYPGAWMAWCDPEGHWSPLLQGVSGDSRMGGFTLVQIADRTVGIVGGPVSRMQIQGRIDRGESFVLLVPARQEELGWLWAHALLAEWIYSRSLREQLLEWGWRPQSLTITDDELAVLARQNLQQDPADWGGGGLEPSIPALLEVLAAGASPNPEDTLILDLTVEAAGLPPIDHADLPRWRSRALARLLVTDAHRGAPRLVGEGHELLIPPGQRECALELLDQWGDSLRLRKGLPEAIIEADRIAGLGSALDGATVKVGPFLSLAAERAVFAHTCSRLGQKRGKDLLESLTTAGEDIARHAAGFWVEDNLSRQAIPWGELLRLGKSARSLLELVPTSEWARPDEAIAWYTANGWRIDQAGEELLRNLAAPAQEVLSLITPLRAAYRAVWESTLIHWTQVWSGAGCPMPPVPSTGDWLADQLSSSRPTAILVVDALRYGVGSVLAQQLNTREGAERATVRPGRAPLPSITALGMGTALPIPEAELGADLVDGKWQLRQEGRPENLSDAAGRRKWWHTYGKVADDAICSLADVLVAEIPSPAPKRTRLVIYDSSIDKLGHDDELEAAGTGGVIERYLGAIQRLSEAGWSRTLIVTDHGYIHWPTSEEKNASFPAPNPAYSSRRALAYPSSVTFSGPQGLAPGGRWRVAVPSGAASFRTYGGMGYFHGGASLQEWIVPCITIEWPLQARPLEVQLRPLEQILSLRPRVTLVVERDTLLVEDSTARQVEVLIRDAQRRTILFRSEPQTITPDREEVSVSLRAVDNASADRGTALSIEVRDTRTEEIIASATSTLMTEMTGW